MSFKDCIASAVTSRGLSQDRADTAAAAFDEAYEQAVVDGMGDGAASQHAAGAAMESITKVNAERRWQKVKEMQVAHALAQVRLNWPSAELGSIASPIAARERSVVSGICNRIISCIKRPNFSAVAF